MSKNIIPVPDAEEVESYPVTPRYHPVHRFTRTLYDFMASAKLAMVLLVAILVCCVIGVTLYRDLEAIRVVFSTIWFNSLLVLLIVNIACCFFGRVWHRKLTIISFGMILFHLSFVSMLGGIIYNSLFCFRGSIRLTEGESLPSGNPQSYDTIDKGRFFSLTKMKGETSLIRMHTGYKVTGENKRAAYEVVVGDGATSKQGIIYVTHKLTNHGFDYFNDKEGYSLLLTLSDKQDKLIYGAHLPLQSFNVKNESHEYATGYTEAGRVRRDAILFPAAPEKPRYAVQLTYTPIKQKERSGEVQFEIFGLDEKGKPDFSKHVADTKVPVGGKLVVGDLVLSVPEVRYWVGMLVRYEPGKPIVLTSLWVALAGMIITTIGRMIRVKP